MQYCIEQMNMTQKTALELTLTANTNSSNVTLIAVDKSYGQIVQVYINDGKRINPQVSSSTLDVTIKTVYLHQPPFPQ